MDMGQIGRHLEEKLTRTTRWLPLMESREVSIQMQRLQNPIWDPVWDQVSNQIWIPMRSATKANQSTKQVHEKFEIWCPIEGADPVVWVEVVDKVWRSVERQVRDSVRLIMNKADA